MSFTQIIKSKYTVTTVLIMPLWDKRMPQLPYRGYPHLRFPFMQACGMHGFINAYSAFENQNGGYIYLLFKRESVLQPWDIRIQAPTYSLNELLLLSEDFEDIIYEDEEHMVYRLEIPKQFKSDVDLIRSGHYQKVSKKYKREIVIGDSEIPTEDNVMNIILAENIPYHICNRSPNLRAKIRRELGDPGDREFFIQYRDENEILKQSYFQKIHESTD